MLRRGARRRGGQKGAATGGPEAAGPAPRVGAGAAGLAVLALPALSGDTDFEALQGADQRQEVMRPTSALGPALELGLSPLFTCKEVISPRPHRLGSHEPGSDPVSQPHVCLPPKRLGSGLQPRRWTRTSCCSQTVDTGAGPGGAGSAGPRVHVMEGHTPQQLLSPGHLPFVKLVPEPACAPRLRVTTGLVRSPGRRARASIPACRGARVPSHTQGLFPALSLASCPGLCFINSRVSTQAGNSLCLVSSGHT